MTTLVLLFFGVLGLGAGFILGGYLSGERLYIYVGITMALISLLPLFLSALLGGGSKAGQT
ncbi:MAG: hypothetical protein QXW60_04590 [Nitrososphaerota archaeon]